MNILIDIELAHKILDSLQSINSPLAVDLQCVINESEAGDQRQDIDDSMDGDFDSAMSSAGLGTDEDYGTFSESDF
jgi:hypothetical protein